MTKFFFIFGFLFLCLVVQKTEAQKISTVTIPPVLIELFTSQGCSSCPPAENLLNTWGMGLFQAKKALPLAFHVDYWDYLDWKDPFSLAEASDRQKTYGAFFQADSIYTPQMIVQGQAGFNGSDQERAQQELAQARTSSVPPLSLSAISKDRTIDIQVSIPAKMQRTLSKNLRLCMVVFENDLETTVSRGENSGSLLKENFVVRSLRSVSLSGSRIGTSEKLSLPNPRTKPSHTGVAVWLQDPQTMKIQGLQWVYPLSKN